MSDQQPNTPLVNLSERYHLLGVTTEEREDNSGLSSSADQHVPGQVVYTTNDKQEANAIARNNGWMQDGIWVAVSGWRDSQRVPSEDLPAPLRYEAD